MPALLPVPGVARCVVRGTANGQAIVNVFHVRNGASDGAPAYTLAGTGALAAVVSNAYTAQFPSILNNSWSGDTVTVTDLSGPTGPSSEVALSGSGGISSANMPQSVAACITWKIPRHYRGGHPRTYIGPLAVTALETPTSFTTSFITSLTTKANAFLTAINGATVDGRAQRLVCVHRQIDGLKILTPITSEIAGGSCDTRLDTMRRRLGPDR